MKRTKKAKARQKVILSNDPSLAEWGWVVLDSNRNILESGCIKTKKESGKRRIRVSDDRIRRIQLIVQQLYRLYKKYEIVLMLFEAPHGSQTASGAMTVGLALAILTTYGVLLNIPMESYSERDAKKAISNKISLSKSDTIKIIDKLFEVPWSGVKYKDEAIADALAVYELAEGVSPVLRFILNQNK